MQRSSAESTVTTSALIVGVVYAYRYFTEGPSSDAPSLAHPTAAKQLAGAGGLPPLSHFIIGYGFAFMIISVIAQAEPDIGGPLAALVALGTVLAQGQALFGDVGNALTAPATHGPTAATTTLAAAGRNAQRTARNPATTPVQSGASSVAGGVDTGIAGIGGNLF